jgi:predicted nucleotide-binding protein (sugar kinase/HSP70/actin superfamily)
MLKPARSSSPPPLKIGFPRAMVYFEYGQLWRDFFESLGCEVVLSPKTNKSILNRGVASCTNETCLPVKALHGHVLELCGKVDFVFLPRYVSCGKRDYTCPKLCALPDMARLNLKEAPPILEAVVDEKTGYIETEKSLKAAASALGLEKDRVLSAFYAACAAISSPAPPPEGKRPAVGLLGHPYMLHGRVPQYGPCGKARPKGLRLLTPRT